MSKKIQFLLKQAGITNYDIADAIAEHIADGITNDYTPLNGNFWVVESFVSRTDLFFNNLSASNYETLTHKLYSDICDYIEVFEGAYKDEIKSIANGVYELGDGIKRILENDFKGIKNNYFEDLYNNDPEKFSQFVYGDDLHKDLGGNVFKTDFTEEWKKNNASDYKKEFENYSNNYISDLEGCYIGEMIKDIHNKKTISLDEVKEKLDPETNEGTKNGKAKKLKV